MVPSLGQGGGSEATLVKDATLVCLNALTGSQGKTRRSKRHSSYGWSHSDVGRYVGGVTGWYRALWVWVRGDTSMGNILVKTCPRPPVCHEEAGGVVFEASQGIPKVQTLALAGD